MILELPLTIFKILFFIFLQSVFHFSAAVAVQPVSGGSVCGLVLSGAAAASNC